jgi:hypothetical protein
MELIPHRLSDPNTGLCVEPNRELLAGYQGIKFLLTGLQTFISVLDVHILVASPPAKESTKHVSSSFVSLGRLLGSYLPHAGLGTM